MPSRRLPNSIPAVLRTLKTARDTWKLTPAAADRALSAEHWAKLNDADANSLLNRCLKEASDVDLAQAAQTPLTSQLSQAAARLTQFVSHFHQVLDLGIARGTFAPGARSYYSRDVNASSIPDLADYDAVAEAAENIVKGETARATAEAAGGATWDGGGTWDSGLHWDGNHVAMSLPSAAQVDTERARFVTLHGQSQAAQTNTDLQREQLQALLYVCFHLPCLVER